MKCLTPRAVAVLLVSLLAVVPALPALRANPLPGPPPSVITDEVEWARDRIVDSIYVVGNQKVRDIAILREMELREGLRFDPVAFERDQRYIGDLRVFADVVMTVEPAGDDRCVIRVTVTERPTILLKLVYPILEYDFNSERLKYGAKWNDRNFRKRLENFSVDAVRDNRSNDNAAIGWGTRWFGWRRIGLATRASYFHRGQETETRTVVRRVQLSTGVSLPLTDSRISAVELLSGMAYTDNRLGALGEPSESERLISPSIGFRFDNRDSQLKPRNGRFFSVNVGANKLINADRRDYYRLVNDVRHFQPLNAYTVMALWSRLDYQFGNFPEYSRIGLGGAGSLRGYESSQFDGAHRWNQTVELRFFPWAKRFYRLPFAGLSDFLLGLAVFADTGLVWSRESEFRMDAFHGGFGAGLRLYSPFQDVVRVDVGFNTVGSVRVHFSTGTRF